jgi:hypothetical protein
MHEADEGVTWDHNMASALLEAVAVPSARARANTQTATTEGNSSIVTIYSALEEADTDNSHYKRRNYSVLEGSKTHAYTGFSNPLLLGVLCDVHVSYSVKGAHG